MGLFEVAYAVRLFGALTSFDRRQKRFNEAVGDMFDPRDGDHARACLIWLNGWGCRHFAVQQHEQAAASLAEWWSDWGNEFIGFDVELDELTEEQLEAATTAYGDLIDREAGQRHRRGRGDYTVRFGPTGAGKVMHVLCPKALPPWDERIRISAGYERGRGGYLRFLRDTSDQVGSCGLRRFALGSIRQGLGPPWDARGPHFRS